MYLLNLFFLLMFFIPTMYQAQRGGVMLILLLGSIKRCRRIRLYSTIRLLAIVNIFASIFFVFEGLLLGAPGALNMTTVFVIWPILFIYFSGICNSLSTMHNLIKMVLVGGGGIVFINLVFLINEMFFHISFFSQLSEVLGYNYGFFEGMVEFNSPTLSFVPYVFVYAMTLCLIDIKGFVEKKYLLLLLAFSAITILLSARRAFWLLMIISPFISFMLIKLSKIKLDISFKTIRVLLMGFIFLLLILMFVLVSILDIDLILRELVSSFDFEDNESNYLRKQQFTALTNLWLEHPMLGAGLGSFSPECIRTPHAPWEYELTYNCLLAQTGVIGVAIYSLSVLWIFVKSIKIVRNSKTFAIYILPQLSGLLVFIICNSSNPYLFKFDFLWILFLPICTINAIYFHQFGSVEK